MESTLLLFIFWYTFDSEQNALLFQYIIWIEQIAKVEINRS